MRRLNFAACVCAGVLSTGFNAAIAADEPAGWQGEIEASAVATTGNTENTNLGLKAKFKRKIGRFIHAITGNVNYAEQVQPKDGKDQSVTTQDRWLVSYQIDAQLRDRTYGYTRVQYDEDRFSGFNKRWFVGFGLGHDIYASEKIKWSIEAGPGYRWAEIDNPAQVTTMDGSEEFAAYADSDIDLQLRENVSLLQNANVTYADSNTTYDTVVGLQTKLTETLSSKVSYQVKYETDPPAGRENRDTMLKASLLLGF